MPPKRKAEDAAAAPMPKKSKAEQIALARAKAQEWAKKELKSPAAATKPSSATKAKSTAKRSRKSTGTSSDSDSVSSRRRSTGGVTRSRRSAAVGGEFKFQPIAEETAEATNADTDNVERGPNGTPVRGIEYVEKATTPFKFTSGSAADKASAKKEAEEKTRKKKEALERARAYGDRLKKNRLSAGGAMAARDEDSDDEDELETLSEIERKRGGRKSFAKSPAKSPAQKSIEPDSETKPARKSIEPPEAPAASKQSAAVAAAKPPATTQPPAALTNIFSPKTFSAHRPTKEKFNPENPFPTRGYKLPTAAYCGCGPTPAFPRGDVCLDDASDAKVGSYDAAKGGYAKEAYSRLRMDNLPSVDPPYQRSSSGDLKSLDRKSRDPDGDVYEKKIDAADVEMEVGGLKGDAVNDASRGRLRAATETVKPGLQSRNIVSAKTGTPSPSRAVNESIAKAHSMMVSVADSNRRRREALGIKSDSKKDVAVQMRREPEEVDAPRDPVETNDFLGNDGMEGDNANDGDVEDNLYEEEIEPPSFIKRTTKRILFVLGVVMMAQLAYGTYYIISNYMFDSTPTNQLKLGVTNENQSSSDTQHCFIDHPSDFFTPNESINESLCAGKYISCPQWGRCHGGKLQDCHDGGNEYQNLVRFIPNANGDGCVPTKQVGEVIELIQHVLGSMTVGQHCNLWNKLGKGDVIEPDEEQSYPMFRLEKVVEVMRSMYGEESILNGTDVTVQLLMWLEPVESSGLRFGSFSTDEDGIDAIGLIKDFPPGSLPVPLSCWARDSLWQLSAFSFGIFGHLTTFAWHYVKNYPITSGIVLLLFYIIHKFIQRKRRLAKINEILGPVLEATYDRLAECDNNDGYAALMLRDDIGRDMFPTNIKARTFLYNDVWPRVIREIQTDNRVRKFREEANGKNLEHWDLHKQPKQGRRKRKSLVTPKQQQGDERRGSPVSRDP